MTGMKPGGTAASYSSGGTGTTAYSSGSYGTYGQSSTYPSTAQAYGQSPSYGQPYGQMGTYSSAQGAYSGSYPQTTQGGYQSQTASSQSSDYGQKDYGQRDYSQRFPQSGSFYGSGQSDGYGRRQDYPQQPGAQSFQGRRSEGGWQSDRTDDRYRASGQGYGSYGQTSYQQQTSGWGRAYEASQSSDLSQRQQPQQWEPSPTREEAPRTDTHTKSTEEVDLQGGSDATDVSQSASECSPNNARVTQLAGLSFGQVHRIPVDIAYRCPRLQMALDFQEIICYYADHAHPFPMNTNLGATIAVSEDNVPFVDTAGEEAGKELDMVYDAEGQKQAAPLRHFVRVMLLTADNEPGRHLCRRLNFVILKCSTGKWCVPGGQYSSELDGPDAHEDATLKRTACRLVQAQIGADLSQCQFHKFTELFYETGSSRSRVVFFIPETWTIGEPVKAYTQVKEVVTPYTAQEEVEEDMTEEDIENFHKQWRDALEQERIAMAAVIPGEREVDRLERLDKFEDEMKEKEDNPPVPPKTKKVMRSIQKQRVTKQPTLVPAYASLIDLAEYQQPPSLSTEDFNSIFEVKLFALCFDEMLRFHFSSRIVQWLKEFPLKKQAEEAEQEQKRKREEDRAAHRAAKRQRREEDQFTAAEAQFKDPEEQKVQSREPATTDAVEEATSSPAPQGPDNLAGASEEPPAEVPATSTTREPADEEMIDEEPELPQQPTRTVVVQDSEEMEPFAYFDSSYTTLSFYVHLDRIESLLYSTGELCFREVEEFMKLLHSLTASSSQFNYAMACSHNKEEPISEDPPAGDMATVAENDQVIPPPPGEALPPTVPDDTKEVRSIDPEGASEPGHLDGAVTSNDEEQPPVPPAEPSVPSELPAAPQATPEGTAATEPPVADQSAPEAAEASVAQAVPEPEPTPEPTRESTPEAGIPEEPSKPAKRGARKGRGRKG
eukprot:GGOE01065554.1.p1 GENE.GGOE01065554.1~~GGOE01065554.1.p1  ORF type:complete len:1107 (+),score=214.67 GGOE01065554.1:487-3321(+)